MRNEQIIILGAGGHARVIADILSRQRRSLLGFMDDHVNGDVVGLPCLGPISNLESVVASLGDGCVSLVVGIGDNHTRYRVVERIRHVVVKHQISFATVLDPSSVISVNAQLGPGTVVMPNAVVNSGARVGSHTIINTAATVDHDCIIGDFVHLSPGVHLAGNVVVQCGAHLGIGAVVIPGVRIGSWTIVGAGSSVVRDIPDGVVAYGVPATARRQLGEQ